MRFDKVIPKINGSIFLPHGVVLPYQTVWQYSDVDPERGRRMQEGYEKNRIFSTNVSLYLGNDTR